MIVTFFLKLGTFFINYFGKLDTLINTLAYVRHFDILCSNKLCQIGEDAYVYVNCYIIIQNKWHRGRRWKFKFTLAARPLLIIP
jgi:hypothetical protein